MPSGSAYQALILPPPHRSAPPPRVISQAPTLPPIITSHAPPASSYSAQSARAAYTPPAHATYSTAAIPQGPIAGGNLSGFVQGHANAQNTAQSAIGRMEKVLQLTKALSTNPFVAASSPVSRGTQVNTSLSGFLGQSKDPFSQTLDQYNKSLQKISSAFGSSKQPVSLLSPVPSFASKIKLPPGMSPQMQAVVKLANTITSNHYNYEWGGGHGQIGVPGSGSGHGSGPGVGFDCSGAVSAVLHAAGVLNQPLVAEQFMSFGKPGPGTGPNDITIYASPTHTFAQIGGKFFGTSGQNPGGGAAWFKADPGYTQGFVARHVTLPAGGPLSVLAKPQLPVNAKGLMQFVPRGAQKATIAQYAKPGSKPQPLNPQQAPRPITHPSQLQGVPTTLGKLFIAAGKKYGVDPALLAGVAQAETSMGQDRSTSSAGAQGLMQFEPGTARELGVNPFNDRSAVFGAARLLTQFGIQRDPTHALAAYNAGPGNVGAGMGYAAEVQRFADQFRGQAGGVGSISAPVQGGGSAVLPSGGGSAPAVSGGSAAVSPSAAPQTPSGSAADQIIAGILGNGTSGQTAQQQQQMALLQSFLSGSNPWDVGPKTSGFGGQGLSSLFSSSSSDLGSLATRELQKLAGGVPLKKVKF